MNVYNIAIAFHGVWFSLFDGDRFKFKDYTKIIIKPAQYSKFLKLLNSGKTSVVKYLAGLAGTKVIRINNHEHTDLQEYVGSYCVGENDKLAFKEGKALLTW